jgi:hypothetical protein
MGAFRAFLADDRTLSIDLLPMIVPAATEATNAIERTARAAHAVASAYY